MWTDVGYCNGVALPSHLVLIVEVVLIVVVDRRGGDRVIRPE